MNYKYILGVFIIIVSVFAFSGASVKPAAAISGDANVTTSGRIEVDRDDDTRVTSLNRATSSDEDRGNATSSENKDERDLTVDDDNDNNNNNKATSTSEIHRSVVATFVQVLLKVADREDGIGDQVREIAQSQNDSATTTATAMAKIESRGRIKELFFGSDYKNIGVIRSQIDITTNNIAWLKSLLDQTTSTVDRIELNDQVQVLEAEQEKVQSYVMDHENTRSIFGWFVRLFVK